MFTYSKMKTYLYIAITFDMLTLSLAKGAGILLAPWVTVLTMPFVVLALALAAVIALLFVVVLIFATVAFFAPMTINPHAGIK
jgi:hypothetical protein